MTWIAHAGRRLDAEPVLPKTGRFLDPRLSSAPRILERIRVRGIPRRRRDLALRHAELSVGEASPAATGSNEPAKTTTTRASIAPPFRESIR